jgi:two-component system, cell cycle sensor histidine kinase and response regulator CckA
LPSSPPDSPPDSSQRPRVGTILVVDDEEGFRATVVRQLNDAGFDAIEARDGAEAIRIFAARSAGISAVLLDLVMPNTSGGETLVMLRAQSPALPVVITSGYSTEDALSLKETERGVGFLRKPFTAAELTKELHRVMAGQLPGGRHSTPPRPSTPPRSPFL